MKNAKSLYLDLWLDDNQQFRINQHRDKMMSFGIGKRNCPGQALAMRSLYLTFSKLLLRYKFELPAHLTENVDIKRDFQFTFTINPKIDLKVSRL